MGAVTAAGEADEGRMQSSPDWEHGEHSGRDSSQLILLCLQLRQLDSPL